MIKSLLKKVLPTAAVESYRAFERERALPAQAKHQRSLDAQGLHHDPCSPVESIELAMQWLCRAQDRSRTADGGVARHYSLIDDWSPSYPETTGYIVPTFITLAHRQSDDDYLYRAQKMLDWLVSIQMQDGGFPAGTIDREPIPVTFNTGQILIGLAAGVQQFGTPSYNEALLRASTWLRDTLDDDGCWRKFATPFAEPGEKSYETHVSWGLFEAERVAPGHGFADAAMRQISWAAQNVQPNGWIKDCCLVDPQYPLTHTIGYALRGFIEAYRFSEAPWLLELCENIGQGLTNAVDEQGWLSARLDADWQPARPYVCLTGSVQNAANLFDLYKWTNNARYYETAQKLVAYVRSTIHKDREPNTNGAVAGSFPIDGGYGTYEYLNWSAKFFIDAQCLALDIEQHGAPTNH